MKFADEIIIPWGTTELVKLHSFAIGGNGLALFSDGVYIAFIRSIRGRYKGRERHLFWKVEVQRKDIGLNGKVYGTLYEAVMAVLRRLDPVVWFLERKCVWDVRCTGGVWLAYGETGYFTSRSFQRAMTYAAKRGRAEIEERFRYGKYL